MRIIRARNVQDALPIALALLEREGVERPSRNGPVLIASSVTTIYERPCERVLFHPARDANPFFHLYESLWMLAGRNDVEGPARYAKNMANYSDDGQTLHGAYGHRWRRHFNPGYASIDQLRTIARTLTVNKDDRRCVLQMWDPNVDLGNDGKDVPCNVTAAFQRGIDGELNLTVFCRSNDIIWGCYGANAVHFSFLLEYMALWMGCPVGTYTQISVNWHAYLDTFDKVKSVRPDRVGFIENPYISKKVYPAQMFHCDVAEADDRISDLLFRANNGFSFPSHYGDDEPFFHVAHTMLRAHHEWKTRGAEKYDVALERLSLADQSNDWIVAGQEWIRRRQAAAQMRQVLASDADHI